MKMLTRFSLWWALLTIEEKFAVKYLELYKKSKEVFGLRFSQIKKFLPAPPDLKKEHFCSVCKRKIWRREGYFGKTGTDIVYCMECYAEL